MPDKLAMEDHYELATQGRAWAVDIPRADMPDFRTFLRWSWEQVQQTAAQESYRHRVASTWGADPDELDL